MMAGMLGHTEWFIIQSGSRAGQPHLSGWVHTALRTLPTRRDHDDWVRLGICPRCRAVVFAENSAGRENQEWAHEQWHAATDFPIPEELKAQLT